MKNALQTLPKTMSSVEIAKLTGKRHDNVIRDIRKMIADLEINSTDFIGTQKYGNGNTRKVFNLPMKYADLLLDKYNGLARVPYRLQEEAALKTIEQLLNITLIRQFQCLNYRIDGYDALNNIAYEIDEPHHKSKKSSDLERERRISKALNCRFVRIKL